MANVIPTSFKSELLSGTHNFASGGNSFKIALYTDISCLLYTSPSPRDRQKSRMPSSA